LSKAGERAGDPSGDIEPRGRPRPLGNEEISGSAGREPVPSPAAPHDAIIPRAGGFHAQGLRKTASGLRVSPERQDRLGFFVDMGRRRSQGESTSREASADLSFRSTHGLAPLVIESRYSTSTAGTVVASYGFWAGGSTVSGTSGKGEPKLWRTGCCASLAMGDLGLPAGRAASRLTTMSGKTWAIRLRF
jgi:hypothetical protein